MYNWPAIHILNNSWPVIQNNCKLQMQNIFLTLLAALYLQMLTEWLPFDTLNTKGDCLALRGKMCFQNCDFRWPLFCQSNVIICSSFDHFFIADEILIQTTQRMKEKILNGKCVRCHFHILFTSFIKLIFSRFCFLILTILGIKGTLQCTGAFSYFVNWRDMMLPFPI